MTERWVCNTCSEILLTDGRQPPTVCPWCSKGMLQADFVPKVYSEAEIIAMVTKMFIEIDQFLEAQSGSS